MIKHLYLILWNAHEPRRSDEVISVWERDIFDTFGEANLAVLKQSSIDIPDSIPIIKKVDEETYRCEFVSIHDKSNLKQIHLIMKVNVNQIHNSKDIIIDHELIGAYLDGLFVRNYDYSDVRFIMTQNKTLQQILHNYALMYLTEDTKTIDKMTISLIKSFELEFEIIKG